MAGKARGRTGPTPPWAAHGEALNGWLLEHSDKPARIPEEHSETPYMTRRAMAFIDQAAADGRNWCLHLSYIKPHWPYIAPAPYHALYRQTDVVPRCATPPSGRIRIRYIGRTWSIASPAIFPILMCVRG